MWKIRSRNLGTASCMEVGNGSSTWAHLAGGRNDFSGIVDFEMSRLTVVNGGII